jgi:hypothetical protein
VFKMMIVCLASFLRVSPFRKTQDPVVYARLDFLYRDAGAMEKLDEVDDELRKPARPCMKYVEHKMLAWYTMYLPKNNGAVASVEASAPPPRTPDRPAAAADGPNPKRGTALSDDESKAAK